MIRGEDTTNTSSKYAAATPAANLDFGTFITSIALPNQGSNLTVEMTWGETGNGQAERNRASL